MEVLNQRTALSPWVTIPGEAYTQEKRGKGERTLQLQRLNDLMESKGGKKKSSSSKSLFYEAPLGYSIEDVRPHGGIKKFRTAAYSNCVRKPS
ncbi:hypothetical protein GH714_012974 [Hevea brasiliensis]|uniref:Uncharacterized protein n=1 Tax=Hevea brasiliensis TaxID=3981 RepID=A0A6A6MMH9_HEVBR|nr:hypothetical protein GH714_012974 [Hevea brasiliensis]